MPSTVANASTNSSLRIASLISSGTEIIYALGLGDAVVAVSHECDYPPAVAQLPRVTLSNVDSLAASGEIDEQVKELSNGGTALYEIDRDALIRLRPDVIITQAQCDVCAVRYQEVLDLVQSAPELSHTRVIALNPQSLGDVFQDMLRAGEALDACQAAEHVVAQLRSRIAAVRDRTRSLPRPRVACIEWIEPLMLAANWTPELIDIAGGHCPLATAGAHSTYSSWDDVLAFDPEVLVVAPCGFDLPRTIREAAVIAAWPHFNRLSAVRQGRVYAADGNAYFNRSGPRLVESVEILVHLFHPDTFSGTGVSPVTNRCDAGSTVRSLFPELRTTPQSRSRP